MYYLLGYRIVRNCQETVTAALNEDKLNELVNWDERQQLAVGQIGRSHIFRIFDEQVLRKVCIRRIAIVSYFMYCIIHKALVICKVYFLTILPRC